MQVKGTPLYEVRKKLRHKKVINNLVDNECWKNSWMMEIGGGQQNQMRDDLVVGKL